METVCCRAQRAVWMQCGLGRASRRRMRRANRSIEVSRAAWMLPAPLDRCQRNMRLNGRGSQALPARYAANRSVPHPPVCLRRVGLHIHVHGRDQAVRRLSTRAVGPSCPPGHCSTHEARRTRHEARATSYFENYSCHCETICVHRV
jgi:hypothetical protein